MFRLLFFGAGYAPANQSRFLLFGHYAAGAGVLLDLEHVVPIRGLRPEEVALRMHTGRPPAAEELRAHEDRYVERIYAGPHRDEARRWLLSTLTNATTRGYGRAPHGCFRYAFGLPEQRFGFVGVPPADLADGDVLPRHPLLWDHARADLDTLPPQYRHLAMPPET
jgi:hypothetical protein